MKRMVLALFLLLAGPPVVAATAVVEHRAVVRLQPLDGRIEAQGRIELPSPAVIRFELAAGLAITEARLDGEPVRLSHEDGVWSTPGPGGVLELAYHGGLGNGADGEPPFLTVEGGFLPLGSGWLPEVRDGAGRFDLTLDVPLPFKAVATGGLVEETERDGRYRARYVSGAPGAGASAFVGRYAVSERALAAGRLRTWFHADDAGLAERYLDNAAAYLRLYDKQVGPYPYTDFHIVAGPLPVGLGFPGLTYVSHRILRLPFMQTTSLAHEILHSWWGNAVEVAYEEGNWAEGLTTYMADHGLVAAESPVRARDMRLAWLRDYNALPPERDATLRAFTMKSHDAGQVVGYNKAAFVFHMLRRRLGEPAFAAALRDVYARHRHGRAGWDDLQASFERALGQDLDTFFVQWLTRTGAPRLHLAAAEPVEQDGRHGLALTLRQDEPAYALQVPIEIETETGRERHKIRLDTAERALILPVATRARVVAVDPDYDVFRRLAPGEAPPIVRDVTLSGAARVLLPPPDHPAHAPARLLAARLLDAGGTATADAGGTAAPLLVVVAGEAAARLAWAGLPPTPPEVAGRGTARVWTARQENGQPLLVVEGDDPAAIEALLRPLPHYRRDSHLVFEGDRMVERGLWPAGGHPLRRRLDEEGPR